MGRVLAVSYEHVTLCFSLPRSRSQWLAWLYGQAVSSWHDPLKLCKHPLELKEMIDRETGPLFIADTAAILFHTAITESLPGATFLYVSRPPQDVCASLKRQTGFPRTSMVYEMYTRLVHEKHAAPEANGGCYEQAGAFARRWWRSVTNRSAKGLPEGFWNNAEKTVIDTPVRDQYVDPFLRNELMRHKEPLSRRVRLPAEVEAVRATDIRDAKKVVDKP